MSGGASCVDTAEALLLFPQVRQDGAVDDDVGWHVCYRISPELNAYPAIPRQAQVGGDRLDEVVLQVQVTQRAKLGEVRQNQDLVIVGLDQLQLGQVAELLR